MLIKTLILNQLKKKKKPQVYLAWLDWLWGPWERLCKPATAQWNRSDLQSAASPRISPTSPSPSSSLNSRTQSATSILLILLLSSLSLGFRKLRNFVTEREKGENWKEGKERRVGSEAVNLGETWKGKVIIVCETITCEEAEILSWDIFCRTNEVWYFCWKKKVKKRLLVWSCGPPRRVWNLSLGKARVRHSPLALTLFWW